MIKYIPFQNFVFRTPLFHVNTFLQEMENLEKEESYWKIFLQNTLIQEAIFLASPVLYEEMGKFLSGYLTREKDIEKMKCAVLRYFSRMTTRCTPFGLFAGFSLGELSNETNITLQSLSSYRRYTRLDMHYLCALAQDIGKNEAVQKNVKYYPNSSSYVLGDKLRYVEYFYKESRRVHNISSVDFSEYLEQVIAFAQNGVFFAELIFLIFQMLPEENITVEEAVNFITELINNQILVSDLEQQRDEQLNNLQIALTGAYNQLQMQIKNWEQAYLLITPINGVVTLTKYWQKNQNVNAGEILVTVVPDEQTKIIGKILLPSRGAGKVKEGQMVNVKFDNFPYMEFGMVRVQIKNISLVPTTLVDNQKAYMLEVIFPDKLKTNYGKELTFSQEMTGSAEIITEDLRLLDRFLNPIKAIIRK